jgi:NTP-dependent ternary system trypsin peptidase co-occuring protein
MSKPTIIELPDKKLYFGGDAKSGLSEVSAKGKIARVTTEQFKSALGSPGELVKILEESVGTMPKRPDKVEMEFGASLKSECDLWIVSGGGRSRLQSQALVGPSRPARAEP